MPRMMDLIRASAAPSNIVHAAAKGALSLPPEEMIEVLVHLAVHNPVFGEEARLTLAGWDLKPCRAMASDPHAPKEVLDYLISPPNLRPALLPALLENLSVPDHALAELAGVASREAVETMLKSARVNQTPAVLRAFLANPNLSGIQAETIRQKVAPPPAADPPPERGEELLTEPSSGEDSEQEEDILDEELNAYLSTHADEIVAEADKPFQPLGGVYDEILGGTDEPLAEAAAAGADGGTKPKRSAAHKKERLSTDEQRGSALQKISKLDVKGRIQLAMKGNKEERSILIRDGTKIVALAVIESPKITDGEVEMFASQKNVLEAVLRGIPMKRRFAKHYPIVRNLVSNPRTPLDVSLGLMKNLLVGDLKNLSTNKGVSETVRKLALKMFKQKQSGSKG
jgi:hypothetical protein